MRCPDCGQENPEGFRFCGTCGSELAPAPAIAREERKVVTVLFADLVGFTSRAELMDPEDVRALLGPYHERLRSELERFGGTVEKFIGDAVMALFGAPVAHEDDPERAVRAALAIRDWVMEDDDLQLRIAVNTGEALIALDASPVAGEGMASGDVVNSTARLQAAAPVNGILVGETTYRATRELIDYGESEAVEAKGKTKPMRAWAAIAPRSKLGVDVEQAGRTPLIGRDQELTLLLNTARRVSEDREPQLVTLVGVPGIGKSRLTFELFRALGGDDALRWRQGRCLPYGDGVAFWAIGEIVKSHAEIFESDGADRAEEKLRRAIARAVADQDEAAWIARYLRPLIGVGAEESAFKHDGQADAFAAWRRFFEALGDQGPLVLVIEDLHWADDQMLDFVDHLVDWAADVPLLVVCTARPELLERRPGWGGGKPNATTLSLRPLSDDETARLLVANLDRPVLPAETQATLLERAGGNPLYAEQYARLLAERTDPAELTVPETIHAIVAARLDGLAPEDKALLHDAAVHGKVFWAGAVAAMAELDRSVVEERLHSLERKEFVRRQRRSAVAGEEEYAFRHMLVRDVAYGQIPRRVRADKHRLAAEWIDSLVADRDDHVELLAEHYAHALELARASGGDEVRIAEGARVAFRDAGERASRLGAFAAAVHFYRQSLELWPADNPGRPSLLMALANNCYWAEERGREEATAARDALIAIGELGTAAQAEALLSAIASAERRGADASAHLERALELAGDLPASDAKAAVVAEAARLHFVLGESERALAEAGDVRAIAEEIGDDHELARAHLLLGQARIELGDARGVEDGECAIELARRIRSPWAPIAVGNFAVTLFDLGLLARAFELVAEAQAYATRLGNRPMIAWLDVLRLREHFWTGNWDDAVRMADEAIARTQNDIPEVRPRTVRSQIRLARGRVEEARADSAEALAGGRASQELQGLHTALATHARASFAAGDRAASLNAVDELVERFGSEGSQQLSACLPDFVVVAVDLDRTEAFLQAIAALGKQTPWIEAAQAYAEGDFSAAAATYGRIGSRPDAAYAHLRAAHALVEQGRGPEADAPLREALGFYRSVGATRYVREGEALLAAAS
jgi:class 3 adenylate cyclase/tetratricopeptide (TPR) repeat protein